MYLLSSCWANACVTLLTRYRPSGPFNAKISGGILPSGSLRYRISQLSVELSVFSQGSLKTKCPLDQLGSLGVVASENSLNLMKYLSECAVQVIIAKHSGKIFHSYEVAAVKTRTSVTAYESSCIRSHIPAISLCRSLLSTLLALIRRISSMASSSISTLLTAA